MKLLLILSFVLLIAYLSGVSEARKISSCNCKALAIKRCGSKRTSCQPKCVTKYVRRCSKSCQIIRRTLPKCNCTQLSIQKCGLGASKKKKSLQK